ncbi:site-specific integrase [Corynebacterium diphtheriae]|nr:site-specific integrase [Corynebacterium diphtheriae]
MRQPYGTPTGSLYREKSGRWRFAVTIGYDGSGKQIRKTVSAKTKSACIRKRNQLLREIEDGVGKPPKYADFYENTWLPDYRVNKKPPTVRKDVALHRNYILPLIGEYRLDEISGSDIRAVVDKAKEKTSSVIAAAVYASINRCLCRAFLEGIISRNVCALVPAPKVQTPPRESLTLEETRKLINYAASCDSPYGSMVIALVTMGLRIGEMIGMEWRRVDLHNGLMDVSWQLKEISRVHGKNCGCPDGTKSDLCPDAVEDFDSYSEVERIGTSHVGLVRPKSNSGVRIVPIPDLLLRMLREEAMTAEGRWVWHLPNGKPLSSQSARLRWYAILEGAGVRRVVPHVARHTAITMMVEMGISSEVIRMVAGHAGAISTQRYVHLTRGMLSNVSDKVGGLLCLDAGYEPENSGDFSWSQRVYDSM